MPLTDIEIHDAKPKLKAFKIFDGLGLGLYVQISPAGGKRWYWKYRYEGTEKRLALGAYPQVSLEMARNRCHRARRQRSKGIDPNQAHKAQKLGRTGADNFKTIALECVAIFARNRTPNYSARIVARLEKDIFPWLGKRPIREIKVPELLAVLRRIESRGALVTARRILQSCGQVFRYAVATGRAEYDLTANLRGAFPPRRQKHFATITNPKAVGELLRAIDSYQGSYATRAAMQLAPLVFVRPGELRKAEWQEIDLDIPEWRISAHRMKRRVQHIVPLSRQAVEILRELEPLTNRPLEGKTDAPRYVFPGGRTRERPLSDNAVLSALRRMGYAKEEMSGHGFRSMASTLLHEQGWNHLTIERQLSHEEKSMVSAAYNFAEFLPERRKMMQAWADYLDTLKLGPKISPPLIS